MTQIITLLYLKRMHLLSLKQDFINLEWYILKLFSDLRSQKGDRHLTPKTLPKHINCDFLHNKKNVTKCQCLSKIML